jgi:PST family polysaccharide transporter
MPNPAKSTHGEILKSSALIGSSAMLNIVFRVVRTKAIALILGPTGVGLFGLYSSLVDLTRCISGMGINSSGVRQIAEAVGTGETQRITRTVKTLRRVSFGCGFFGALLLLIFCRQASWLTFNDFQHSGAVALLSFVIFFNAISAGQTTLVQGMRRISDLAKLNIFGAFYGTIFSIPIVYFYHEDGVVPSLVCVALMGIFTSWWYARKIWVEPVEFSPPQFVVEARELLKHGLPFMASVLLTMIATYVIRVIILQKLDLDSVGYFQAAWILGGLYIAFVLDAMGADFFPRLTAVANDNPECNRLVNEQAEIGALLAGPGAIATLTLAPFVIHAFYSQKFGSAVGILNWICLGMTLRVVSWPMGYILIAKGRRGLFFVTELLKNLVFVALVWAGIGLFKLDGAGIGFFGMYVVYWTGIYFVVRQVSGFRWSASNRRLGFVFVPLAIFVFYDDIFLPRMLELPVDIAITLLTGVYSLKKVCTLISLKRFPHIVQKLLRFFRLAPAAPLPEPG